MSHTMNTALSNPPASQDSEGAHVHLFDVGTYRKLHEQGHVGSEAKVQLLDGMIYEMTPMGARHAIVMVRLTQKLSALSSGAFLFASQVTIALDGRTAVDPDFVILSPGAEMDEEKGIRTQDVLVVIEVADSSLSFDRDRKAPLYARAGILEYWIVDLNSDTVIAHREPRPEGYRVIEYFKDEPEVVSQTLPALKIPLKDLFASGGSAEKA